MTTTMVSLDGLRELAAFRAENGCAISLYLDLDPSRVPTAGDTATRVHSLLDLAAKSHGATRPDLAHEVRSGLKADFERLEQFFDGEFDRDGAHGLAVFADGPDNVWSVLAAAGTGRRTRRASPTISCWRRSSRCSGAGTARSSPSSAASRDACWRSGTVAWSRSRTGRRRRRASTTRVAGRRPASSGTSRTWRRSTTGPSPRSWRRGSAALGRPRDRRRVRRGDAARVRGGAVAGGRRCGDRLDDRRGARVRQRSLRRRRSRGSSSGAPAARARRSSAGVRRPARARAAPRAGRRRSRRLPTAGSSCCSTPRACRRTRSAAPPAGVPRSTRPRARSTGRRWRRATTGSTSPSG